ncbi:MAG: hypothetical protein EOP87_00005 [Verrucomicrobiaceae bacterium]|nr:MAG: hypothetical protein EOP87_00005 [Verrucomicrobiaceae bacterium]
MDFKEVAAAALARAESLVPQWLPGGKRIGREWVCGSLQGGPGDSCKVNLETGKWSDFAIDGKGTSGGDLVSLYAAIRGIKQPEAARQLEPGLTADPEPVRTAPRAEWTPLPRAPDNAPEPPFRDYAPGDLTATWRYATRDGRTIGWICRYDTPGGGKEFRPLSWCRGPGGATAWKPKAFAEPRPLYGLETLRDTGTVYLTEGEKSADALRRLLPSETVLTWPGGSNAVAKADWSPLAGREVIIWPDADPAGLAAALAIQQRLPRAHIAKPGEDRPKGWDAADALQEGWTESDVMHFLSRPAASPAAEPPQDQDRSSAEDRHYDLPFRMLGVSDGKYYYMPDAGLEIVDLPAVGHGRLNLMRMAPLQDWEAAFPKKSGADWDAAANTLLQRSAVLPKFDPRRVRGRGCWIDGEDVVFHAGGHLVVNGGEQDIRRYGSPTRSIYEGALEIPTHGGHPARNAEAAKLLELCAMLSWERPISGILLAGWLALAPICGALGWRPHLWVTGPSGSGKSWTVSNIISPMVGKICLSVQGNTTEAGIRGLLGCDAMPVIFDEAESEDHAGQMRLDKVLELARQASSESGAGIIKGTATGGSVTYMVRSMFLFSSIGVAATKKADTSRISVLNLRKSNDQQNFERIKTLWAETVQKPAYAAAIRARSLANALTIRKNADVFSGVAVEFTGDKRSADQIGTLLAGAFSLASTKVISATKAREFMARQDWDEHRSDEVDGDEHRCFSHLMESHIPRERGERIAVGEMVEMASRLEGDAPEALRRWGMKVLDGKLWIANNHAQLELLFRDTPWSGGKWKLQFSRMKGAQKMEPSNFGPSCTQRAVSLPL